MKIKITGNRCIGCYKYNQYYTISGRGELEAIDCGYCGIKQCRTRPGNRCKEHMQKSNVGLSEEQLLRLQWQKQK